MLVEIPISRQRFTSTIQIMRTLVGTLALIGISTSMAISWSI